MIWPNEDQFEPRIRLTKGSAIQGVSMPPSRERANRRKKTLFMSCKNE